MGLFDLFRHDKKVSYQEIFDSVRLSPFYEAFAEEQNRAVDIYFAFASFMKQLNTKYPEIQINKKIHTLNFKNATVELTVGECMYLYMLTKKNVWQDIIEEDFVIATEANLQDNIIINYPEYSKIISKLSHFEQSYCEELKEYLKKNIVSVVNETSTKAYGYKKAERVVPLNTVDLLNYHKYIASEDYFDENIENKNWNQIFFAPIFQDKTTPDNPLIVSDITAINVFVLDYLCYATMALPTLDLRKVLRYSQNGKTVQETITEKLGVKPLEFINKFVTEMHCSNFRTFVRMGLKL